MKALASHGSEEKARGKRGPADDKGFRQQQSPRDTAKIGIEKTT